MNKEGVKKAVLIMFNPKVMLDKVICDRNVISANMPHSRAIRIPPRGIKIESEANTRATIAKAFIVFPSKFSAVLIL